jgi:hypothetical protein
MATVYYNFDSITVSLAGLNTKSVIAATQTNATTNIQYNDLPYFINQLYFYHDSNANQNYFVVQTTATPGESNQCMFFAIPVDTNSDNAATSTDIDKLFEGSGSGSVTVNLSSCLTDGDNAKIYTATDNGWNTVVVDKHYTIKNNLTANNTITHIDHMNLSTGGSIPATIRKQIFGWNMTCSLLGEDENGGQVQTPAVKIDSMDTMALIVTLLLIVTSFYLSVPVVYKFYILPIAMTRTNMPLASIDMYWTAICGLTILSLVSYGLKSKLPSYYFFAFTVGLILFICKKWVQDNIGNVYTNNLAELNLTMTADPTTGKPSHGIDPGYFSVYLTKNGAGFNYKAIAFMFVTMSMYLGISVSSLATDTDANKYTSAIISFMGMAIFTTSMFMEEINWKVLIFGILIAIVTTTPMIIFNVMGLVTKAISK